MSSIIDALKKSDDNRNNEHSANVNSIKFGQNPPPKSKRAFWLIVIILVFIATGVFAWSQGWHHNLRQYTKTWFNQPTQQTTLVDPTTTAAVVDPNEKIETPDQGLVKNQLTPPKQSDIKAKTAELKRQQNAQAQPNNKNTSDTTVTDESKIKPLSANTSDEKNDSKTNSDSKVKSAESAESDVQAKQAADKKSLQPKLKQDYLLLHQIDFAIRKNIPPVKINIHIYDPLPENRMVLMNGERFNIGDIIDEIVTIEDIVQEGVVLKFENVRFLVPK